MIIDHLLGGAVGTSGELPGSALCHLWPPEHTSANRRAPHLRRSIKWAWLRTEVPVTWQGELVGRPSSNPCSPDRTPSLINIYLEHLRSYIPRADYTGRDGGRRRVGGGRSGASK
ncbi:unnamed protein product [Pieris brassicae]|uniref:Uncharacterized protein n=1 Tax=Pieris brassicae TaxID=7116 RepID=A0A9P0XG17_PIEBR|nr:unnamed protein product [Pieris brassicae]